MSSESGKPEIVHQQVAAVGWHIVIIQVVGDHNTVVAGHPQLRLTRYPAHRERQIGTHADLLNPFAMSIPLVGRDEMLEDLRKWLVDDQPISIRALIGRAGIGKTRLALELSLFAHESGWDAGFVGRDELVRFRRQPDVSRWGWRSSTLIVVDYAAAHARLLRAWLAELANERGDPGKPLRILLLERHGHPSVGWWAMTFGPGSWSDSSLGWLLNPPYPIVIPSLVSPAHRRAILNATLERVGSSEQLPSPGVDPVFDRRLSELTWGGEPLLLMMAGLTAMDVGLPAMLALGRRDLAMRMAEREIARIRKIAADRGVDPEFLTRMTAYATLCEGLPRDALAQAIVEEEKAVPVGQHNPVADTVQALFDVSPDANGAMSPVNPDIVGEALVIRVLESLVPQTAAFGMLRRAVRIAGTRVLASLVRTVQDYASEGHTEPILWLKEVLEVGAGDFDFLLTAGRVLPKDTLVLRKFAVDVWTKVVGLARNTGYGQASPVRPQVLASTLDSLSHSLSELGQRDEALDAAREAARIYRELLSTQPEDFQAELARALISLSNRLSAVGDREEALKCAREAVHLCRELPAVSSNNSARVLAASLHSLSSRLSAVGSHEESLQVAEEAVRFFRTATSTHPDASWPPLARGLTNLSTRLAALNLFNEALAPAKEAERLYRELAVIRPDAFRPGLALVLNNLSNRFSDLGMLREALAAVEETVELHRRLVEAHRDAFESYLALALSHLGNMFAALERSSEALAVTEEAVSRFRRLAAIQPETYRADLALVLNNLTNRLGAVDRDEEAVAAARETVDIRRELAGTYPLAFGHDLAGSLTNLANRLAALKRFPEALGHAHEAVDILRPLVLKQPIAFGPRLAQCLSNLANRLVEMNRAEEAVSTVREALMTIEPFFLKQPRAFAKLAKTIASDYARVCKEAGHQVDELALRQFRSMSDGPGTEGPR